MDIDEAIKITQDRLAKDLGSMEELLGHFRDMVSPVLIDDQGWDDIFECARILPATLAGLPFGFELPLHDQRASADFGVSMASGTRAASFFEERAKTDEMDETANSLTRLFREMDVADSSLQEIVGRKVMLEYDIGSAGVSDCSRPGMFIRPGERSIVGGQNQMNDVVQVIKALVSCAGWEHSDAELRNAQKAYMAQPEGTRMDSFGVFPSRGRGIRLAIMGFNSQQELSSYLEDIGWPGCTSSVEEVISRLLGRVDIAGTGVNIDVREGGIGPTLGITPIVRERYTGDSRYWLDDVTDWDPFLEALMHEQVVVESKLRALADWVSKPTTLFAKSGPYLLLRGIHHIKLVIVEGRLQKIKAYVFMALSGAVS